MSGKKKGPPFVQLELDALNKMDPAARLAGVERWSLTGRLAELWAYGLRSQREMYDIREITAFLVGKDEPAHKVLDALAVFNFLEIDGSTVRVCGIGRYFPNEGRKKAAAETNEKKRSKTDAKKDHDRPSTVTVSARSSPQDAPTWGDNDEHAPSLVADRDGPPTVPRIWDLGSRIEDVAFEFLAPGAVENFNPGGAVETPLPAEPAQPGNMPPRGDHVAREDDMPSAGDLARKDRVVAGLFKALSSRPAAPPASEATQPSGEIATPPPAAPINEIRPPESAVPWAERESLEEYLNPASAGPPLEKETASPGQTADELQPHLGKIFQQWTGKAYLWRQFEVEILGELLAVFDAETIRNEWRGVLSDGTATEIKQLKRLMMASKQAQSRPSRVDPDAGIIMRGAR